MQEVKIIIDDTKRLSGENPNVPKNDKTNPSDSKKVRQYITSLYIVMRFRNLSIIFNITVILPQKNCLKNIRTVFLFKFAYFPGVNDISSTSKIKVEFGGITGGMPLSP